ncbi:MAG: hypothetical protein CME06_16585 [Gemmatimonadetes bacterium]|nr:hypothetical protein [Gemmatimonadota bacterium]
MRIDRLLAGGRLRAMALAAATFGLMWATCCVQNRSVLRAVELTKLDGELAVLQERENELQWSLRALAAPERIGPLAREMGLEDEWHARRIYAVAPDRRTEGGVFLAARRGARDVATALFGTREAYAANH